MKKKKPAGSKILLVVSFAVAIVMWFVVSVFLNPEDTRTIGNVPITMSSGIATLDAVGLSVVETGAQNVEVEVSGNRIDLSSLTADDFTVSPIFSGISEAGVYTLDLAVVVNRNRDEGNIEVTAVTPKTVNITVARISTVTLPLHYRVSGDVPDGYFLEEVSLADDTVTVSGPSDVVSRIVAAEILITEPKNGTEDLPVRLLDESGKEVRDATLEQSISDTATTVRLLKTRMISLTADLIGVPDGITQEMVALSVDPGTITVAGPEEMIDAMRDSYSVAQISMSSVSVSEIREVELELPEGVQTVDGTSTVNVSVNVSESIITRYIDLRDFVLSPYLQEFNVTVETVRLRNVEIAGRAEVVDAITAEDIVATVVYDTSDVPQKGRYSMDVEISSPTMVGLWVVGEYEVNVKVS